MRRDVRRCIATRRKAMSSLDEDLYNQPTEPQSQFYSIPTVATSASGQVPTMPVATSSTGTHASTGGGGKMPPPSGPRTHKISRRTLMGASLAGLAGVGL